MTTLLFKVERFAIDVDSAAKAMNIKNDALLDEARALARQAEKIGAPRAVYRRSKVALLGNDTVSLDGAKFTSRVLRVNLDKAAEAYPFVATIGPELDSWAASFSNPADKALAEIVAGMGLGPVFTGLMDEVKRVANAPHMSYMTPGSIDSWPLSEQKTLFGLLGDVRGMAGVELLDTLFMKPNKTVSGIFFPNEKGYENCSLCTKIECPGRRAPHDPNMFDREFGAK